MKNLLRVKVNGKSIIKVCQSSSKQDFYCYFPPILQDDIVVETHFSFHTKTGRTTFKITNLEKGQDKLLPSILKMAKNHPMYDGAVTPTDLDLFKRKITTFEDDATFYPWFRTALNLENSNVHKQFGASKTVDSDFQSVFDIKVAPPNKEQVTISSFIGRNVKSIPDKKDKNYDLSFAVTEANFLKDRYTFIFCLTYDFPKIKEK